jgi:uncharacterized protein (DUF3820 family)
MRQFTFTQTEQSLIRLGLDPAAAEGEIHNCGSKLMLLLRRRGVEPEEIFQYSIQSSDPQAYSFGEILMPFGKNKGLRLREIDPGYLRWVKENCQENHADLCRAIGRFLREIKKGGRP